MEVRNKERLLEIMQNRNALGNQKEYSVPELYKKTQMQKCIQFCHMF